MQLDGLDLGGHIRGSKGDDHTLPDDTGLDTADGHSANTANIVDIRDGETEWLVNWSIGRTEGVKGLEEGGSRVPRRVGASLDQVFTKQT